MAIDFPFARSVLAIYSQRTLNKSGLTSPETRYFLSSLETNERTPARWLDLTRGHWAGIENRNHWRRDACLGEDRTRSRNPKLLINLALIRSATLSLINYHYPERSLPDLKETFAANPRRSLCLIRSP
jgi:hypothetical protein